ncbi:hypothetical protein HanIR_Chr16g0803671 [Helianthus annuus]|nr:hypothetical protein HanIR_Chr16g0803671 [Helianthus annuus]
MYYRFNIRKPAYIIFNKIFVIWATYISNNNNRSHTQSKIRGHFWAVEKPDTHKHNPYPFSF